MTTGLAVFLILFTVVVLYVAIGVLHRNSPLFGRVYARGDRARPIVALTFDDGPSVNATDRVLDVLKLHNVKATFFVIGRNAAGAEALLKHIDAEGHQVANHSFDHHHVGFLRGAWYWYSQLARTNALIERAIGKIPAMYRPPIGLKSPIGSMWARVMGMKLILWSIRSRDGVTSAAEPIVRRVVESTNAGDVILMHDGMDPHRWRDPSGTIEALPEIIRQVRAKGLEFVRLDELLQLPAYRP